MAPNIARFQKAQYRYLVLKGFKTTYLLGITTGLLPTVWIMDLNPHPHSCDPELDPGFYDQKWDKSLSQNSSVVDPNCFQCGGSGEPNQRGSMRIDPYQN
jgi:hypothetical protein